MADSIYAPSANETNGNGNTHGGDESTLAPHPYLKKPLLYISGIAPHTEDKDLASGPFQKLLPIRLNINRDVPEGEPLSGTVEFQTIDKAEKALSTVRSPHLTIESPEQPQPRARSKPRLVKQLPPTTDDLYLYELFRPFGPLVRAHCILTNPAGHHTGFRGMANVEYYFEDDAQKAQNEMHCTEIQGKTISVSIDNVARRPSAGGEFSAQAAPFVPGQSGRLGMSAQAPAFSPPIQQQQGGMLSPSLGGSGLGTSIYAHTPPPEQLDATKGPIFSVPGTNLQYSSSAATYIDPCNLFCKNLCPSLDSNDLFALFKPYGRIVSARVMRDENGKSREFGFVSFTTPEDAAKALHSVNGKQIGTKVIYVRLHEPKKMRQEKLAKRFGSESVNGGSDAASPGTEHDELSPGNSPAPRSVSRDYFKGSPNNAAASPSGTATPPTTVFDEGHLANMTPDVRSEVLNMEFTKRARLHPTLQSNGNGMVKDVVKSLLALNLSDQVKALNDGGEFAARVNDIREALPATPPRQNSLAVPMAATAVDASSVMSTGPAGNKERTRLLNAVSKVMPTGSPIEDVTDMLAGLSKKDRAMCLFNPDFLKAKVEEAKEILDITADDGDDVAGEPASVKAVKDAPIVPPAGASANAEAPAAPAAATPAPATTHTLSSLARLPCSEILRLAEKARTDKSSPGLPLPKVDEEQWRQTDEMMDRILAEKKEAERKQRLGDVLFKKIRTFGIKGAPKVTIALLDSEDLRSLAHVMDAYPELLKEKVNVVLEQQKAGK